MVAFLAVDEIQLAADFDRGHVFTDRLLRARGLYETLFLGAETMRGAIAGLVPGATFLKRERFSELTYTGSKKISRMPERSAIVGFSVENVYAIAELIRRTKGGCAVVMGALSPRTRNAQVALYQNGDVDYLVATDAIGMGLNLDIKHIAFSATAKFDGRRMRALYPQELAQIAGRAGRNALNSPVSSSAKWAPSQRLPPFPAMITLFPLRKHSASISAAVSIKASASGVWRREIARTASCTDFKRSDCIALFPKRDFNWPIFPYLPLKNQGNSTKTSKQI